MDRYQGDAFAFFPRAVTSSHMFSAAQHVLNMFQHLTAALTH